MRRVLLNSERKKLDHISARWSIELHRASYMLVLIFHSTYYEAVRNLIPTQMHSINCLKLIMNIFFIILYLVLIIRIKIMKKFCV